MRSNTKILGQKKIAYPVLKAPTQGEVWGNGWIKRRIKIYLLQLHAKYPNL